MADPILTYLPPGWTEDNLKNAADEDYESLTEEQLQKVMDRSAAEHHVETLRSFNERNAERIARGAEPIPYPHDEYNDAADRQREQSGSSQQVIDPATQNLTNLLDHVEQSDLDIFGFILFRTCYASDEKSWEVFTESFWELLDEGTAAASADFSRIEDRVFIRIVSDNSLRNSTPEGVVGAYLICMEEEEPTDSDDEENWGDVTEPGLTTSMCLYVDEECIRSVVDKSATPFVKAVDVTTNTGQTIKVAIISLVPAFYAALLVYDSADVASKVSADGIWRNIGPWDADMEGRRILDQLRIGE